MLLTVSNAAEAGPFRDFFRTVRTAIAYPKDTQRPRRSTHRHKKTPPSDSSAGSLQTPMPPGPDKLDTRWAKAGSVASDEKKNLPYGTPVPGKPGLVTSPFAPDAGYVQVLGFPPGTPVEDPYTGKVFLTP